MVNIIKNMQFGDPETGSRFRVNDSTFKSLQPVCGQCVYGITLENINSGIDIKHTFEEFSKLIAITTYELIGFRADLVMKDGSVKVSNVYLDVDLNGSTSTIYIDEHLQLSNDDIDYVILKYITDVKYDREGTTGVKVSDVYDMYSTINSNDLDNGHSVSYISSGITQFGVLVRDIDNPQFVDYLPTYKDMAQPAFDYNLYISIVQSFTPWGVIPMMYIIPNDGRTSREVRAFTIFGNTLFPIMDVLSTYVIAETELSISINNEEDVAAAAELGIRMFDEWAYDYSFFIEPIRKYFAK